MPYYRNTKKKREDKPKKVNVSFFHTPFVVINGKILSFIQRTYFARDLMQVNMA